MTLAPGREQVAWAARGGQEQRGKEGSRQGKGVLRACRGGGPRLCQGSRGGPGRTGEHVSARGSGGAASGRLARQCPGLRKEGPQIGV